MMAKILIKYAMYLWLYFLWFFIHCRVYVMPFHIWHRYDINMMYMLNDSVMAYRWPVTLCPWTCTIPVQLVLLPRIITPGATPPPQYQRSRRTTCPALGYSLSPSKLSLIRISVTVTSSKWPPVYLEFIISQGKS